MGSEARVFSPVVDGSLLLEHGAVRKGSQPFRPAADEALSTVTYPIIDSEGDFIQPDGGRWGEVPVIKADWLHGIPVGRGEVEMYETVIDGEKWTLPIGRTKFFAAAGDLDRFDLRQSDARGNPTNKSYSRDEVLHAAAQAKQLVLGKIARGVSVELLPNPAKTSIIGKSLLRNRPAYRYDDWRGIGWAHTPTGGQVNPGAQLVEKALEVARSGKLPGGERLIPAIASAFTPLLSAHPRNASVTSGYSPVGKSMDNPDMVTDAPPPVEAPEESDTPPEATDAYDAAQMVADVAERLSKRAGKTLHKQTKKFYAKLAEKWEQDVEDLLAHAENVEAEAGGGASPDDESEDPEEGAEPPPEGEDDESKKKARYDSDGWPVNHGRKLERDSAGALVLKSHYVPALRLKDLKPVEKAGEAASPELETALAGAVRQLSRNVQPPRRRTNR